MSIEIAMRFVAAIAVGSVYECFDFVRTRAAGLWLSMTGAIPRVPPETAVVRLQMCRQCPIFYAPTLTCGSPFNGLRVRQRPAGCLCFMPFKVKFECNCWLWEEIQDDRLPPEQRLAWQDARWKGALNSDG